VAQPGGAPVRAITQQAIRRGSFKTVRELVRRIDNFVQHYNAGARPFAWTATADSILAKLQRVLQAISETRQWEPFQNTRVGVPEA
jgi:hypothetical protein